MRNTFFLLLIFSLVSCSSGKNDSTKEKITETNEISALTEIEFNEEIHDFGELESGEIAVSTFVLTNIGEKNLLIKNIETDCGCIHVKYPKTVIPPGKTALIEVGFDSSGMFGKQFKSIEIHANCKEPKHLAIFAAVKNEKLEIKY